MIEFDSGEYEFLTEAVQMSAHVEGLLVEVGLRKGWGTKTLIDAIVEYRPGSIVISIDPYGSILYVGREHIGPIRLDYTDDMCKECMADLWEYVKGKNVKWLPFIQTDDDFFIEKENGVVVYDLERIVINKYACVHLDGPHHYDAVTREAKFFGDRMDKGGVIILDDCTEDFINIEPVNEYFKSIGFELFKQGVKKNMYVKH